MAKQNKFDRAQEVAVAMNEIMRLESADQGALLDVVLNYFCEDTESTYRTLTVTQMTVGRRRTILTGHTAPTLNQYIVYIHRQKNKYNNSEVNGIKLLLALTKSVMFTSIQN